MNHSYETGEKIICKKCVLHSKVPGVVINDEGMCNGCQAMSGFVGKEGNHKVSDFFTKRMEALFERKKKENHIYDALVLVSGGKDSTKLLKMAKEKYGLRVLAFSVVTPFVTEVSSRNMEEATKKMNIDLVKFFIDGEVFRDVLRRAVLHGEEYDLQHNAPCQLCYFFIYWAGIRMAMQMDIPIVIGGRDKSQRLNTYISGETVKKNIEKGIPPFGNIHKLFIDAVGEKYGKTIFHFDAEEILKYNYPTEIAPLSFMNFEYEDIEKDIEEAGLEKQKYKKLITTCKAIHFFDFFAFIRYDCPSSIHEWANGLRMEYPELMQLDLKEDSETKNLSREVLLKIMQEYKNVVFFIAGKQIQENSISMVKKEIFNLCETTMQYYSQKAFNLLIDNILQINNYADYFKIDLNEYMQTLKSGGK